MKFELKNEYVKKGSVTSPSTIVLPSGVYKIIINLLIYLKNPDIRKI